MKPLVKIIKNKRGLILFILLVINFTLRILIYTKTVLFNFSDFKVYLAATDTIHNQGMVPLVHQNSIFTISYLGYFAKYILGNINIFFAFNCFAGTLVTYIIAKTVISLSGNPWSGIFSTLLLTIYTEFMVFSSVFYSTIIMLLLLSLLVLMLQRFYVSVKKHYRFLWGLLILLDFILTFLFKPELVFFPLFLLTATIIFFRKDRKILFPSLFLSLTLLASVVIIFSTGIYKSDEKRPIANDFIFFGHTDYGGDGGEGSFVYPENKARYEKAFREYAKSNEITRPTAIDYNSFQIEEIKKYISHHPLKWIKLQFTKFFRTFGVVPETTSFKILYTGLFKNNLWLTSIVVVVPVASIILLFIYFFNFGALKQIYSSVLSTSSDSSGPSSLSGSKIFVGAYLTLFIYYLFITVFLGQYQERYRLPLMVIFIIPVLSLNLKKKISFARTVFAKKLLIIMLFMIIWSFQTWTALNNKQRFINALELAGKQTGE